MGNNKIITCRVCGERVESARAEAVGFRKVDSRSGGFFYTCPACSYATRRIENQVNQLAIIGKPKAHGWRYGYEMESTIGVQTLFLYDNEFKLKRDGSVNGAAWEWISPIYEGLSGIPKVLETIESDISIRQAIDRSCGTHIHISNHNLQWNSFVNELSTSRTTYRGLYDILFSGIANEISSNTTLSRKVWGRTFTGYAKANANYAGDRYIWLNPSTRHGTVEYRLAKLKNKKQFMNLFRLITDVTEKAFNLYKTGKINDEASAVMVKAYNKAVQKYFQ